MSPPIAALRAGATLVTANARLSRQLTFDYDRQCLAEGCAFWEAADILPWSSWLERCWNTCVVSGHGAELVLLSQAQEEMLWERVIQRSTDADGLLDISGTAVEAMKAYDLLQSWELSLDDPAFQLSDDPAAFRRWALEFEREINANSWISRSGLNDQIARFVESGECAAPARVVLAGFDEFAPAQKSLLKAFSRAGTLTEELPAPAITSIASRMGIRDTAAELAAAANWARRLLHESPEARIGVVTPDLISIRAIAERVFDDVLHPSLDAAGGQSRPAFHVSAGPCLTEIPVIAAAFEILSLGRPVLTGRETGVLLRSPFLAGATVETGARALLDAELRRKGFYEIGLRELAHVSVRLAPEFAHLIQSLDRNLLELPKKQGASGWSHTFSRLLRTAGWPGDRKPNSSEHQAMERWNDLLSEFAPVEMIAGAMEYESALGRLRSMAARARFAPADRGAPVQVMGMLEAAGSEFDHLWVAGLEDRLWPLPPRPNPFLPASLQRAHNLPHASPERELAWARKATARLLSSAPDVVVSYPLREADTDLRPSPLIVAIPSVDGAESEPNWLYDIHAGRPDLQELEDSKGPEIPEGEKQRGGTAVIEKQAACPFRAFAECRLGARALEEAAIGLSLQERGQVVHLALRHIWSELRSHAALAASTDSDLSLLISRCVRLALLEQIGDRGAASMPYLQSLEQRRLESLLADWLKIERQRAPFDIVACEDTRPVRIGGLDLQVKVDRVDALPDGRHVIIDYKTGDPNPRQWQGDRPDAPQLPLYAATHTSQLAAVAFGRLAPGESGFKGIGENAGIPGVKDAASLASRVGEWRRTLEQLALEFRAGNAMVAPKRYDTCDNCPLPAFCRITDAGDQMNSEDADE